MISELLGDVFDPKGQMFLINELEFSTDAQERIIRKDYESKLQKEVIENLTKDVEESGLKVNYPIRLIINQISLNVIFLFRVKFYLFNTELVQHKYEHRPSSICNNNLTGVKTMKYEAVESKLRIHPVYDDFVLKLEKTINQQLGILGLLPEQQRELHKMRVIESYKKRLIEIETQGTSYSKDLHIKSEKEVPLNPTKQNESD